MVLTRFDSEAVTEAWRIALQRRSSDPAGAITAARTMLESVLKSVLDDAKEPYGDADDLQVAEAERGEGPRAFRQPRRGGGAMVG